MNVKGILKKTICTVTGVVMAVRYSILAKASSLEEIIGSSGTSGSTDNNVFLNPDGSNAEEVLNSILNPDNNAAAQGQALGEVTDTVKALGSAGIRLMCLLFIGIVLFIKIVPSKNRRQIVGLVATVAVALILGVLL